MRLESARSLKAELMSEDLWKGIRKPGSVRAKTPEEPFERSVAQFVPMAGFFESRTRSTDEIRTEIERRIREGKEVGGLYKVLSHRPARAPSVAPQRPAPLAIGICGRQGSCKLALRVHDAIPGVNTVLDRVSRRARGEVDVRFVGRVVKQIPWRHRRNRPLRIGGSVGHVRITAGTLGCFVTRRDGNAEEDFILSNNHVLANENKARKGDSIVQPGADDGGRTAKDKVGSLASFVRLRKRHNVADAATAELLERIEYYYNFLEGLGPIRGVRTDLPEIGETVYKLGRTTGLTKGRISAVEIDGLQVEYDRGILEFDQQVEIEPVGDKPFSLGGDSGSLIVDSRRRALGLLFAGNDVDATYANPIHEALDLLKVRLVY